MLNSYIVHETKFLLVHLPYLMVVATKLFSRLCTLAPAATVARMSSRMSRSKPVPPKRKAPDGTNVVYWCDVPNCHPDKGTGASVCNNLRGLRNIQFR
jgi:hypothetical protein